MRKLFRNKLYNNYIMSSRSLAAARARRGGESAPPVSGNRPGTSIGSHAAFAPQQQTPPGYNHNAQPNNVRTSKPGNQQEQQQQGKQGLPFTKLTVSDAIGLITLRLGRVEQWVIDTEHENEENSGNTHFGLPENSKIIDTSILNNIVSRLDSLEKRETREDSSTLSENISKLGEQLTRIGDEGIKHNLLISKHSEQLFKFERELVETKDILKTFMIKYDMFASETNNKFTDYEFALSELEKNSHQADKEDDLQGSNIHDIDNENDNENDIENENDNENDANEVANIMSFDLKNIINQELASSK